MFVVWLIVTGCIWIAFFRLYSRRRLIDSVAKWSLITGGSIALVMTITHHSFWVLLGNVIGLLGALVLIGLVIALLYHLRRK